MTREPTRLLYTLAYEWLYVGPCDVAVSESMPDSILVICPRRSYVYQFPCHESTQYVQRYQILDVNPECMAANADTAVIGLCESVMVICSLPGFTNQRKVTLGFHPLDLCITLDYLVVMDDDKIVVRSLGSIDRDVCKIKRPDDWRFRAVSYKNDVRQLCVACYHPNDVEGCVCVYTWDGNGTPQYVNTGCVIDALGWVGYRGLSISSDGLLAVSPSVGPIKVFNLE